MKRKLAAATQKAAQKRKAFAQAYIANGRNGLQAAITAGYSAKTAASAANRLLKNVQVAAMVAQVAEKASIATGLTLERTLLEVARLAYFDPRTLYRADGGLKSPQEWDDDTAAGVASLEVLEEFDGDGEKRKLSGYTKKLKFWDKNAALEKAMKHLGLYERDNSQRGGESLQLQVVLVAK